MTATSHERTVLVGINGGLGTSEVLQAAGLVAERRSARLLVAHVLATGAAAGPDAPAVESQSALDQISDYVELTVLLSGLDQHQRYDIVTRAGEPARQLAELARLSSAEAIVVGQARDGARRWLARGFVTEVGQRLRRMQSVPVVVVPVRQLVRTDPQ